MANRLRFETSPYLLQHADNPVNWYPWGEEPFRIASIENKPVFLSIGYSSCHWCHVMERESFEDPDTGAFMNNQFVSVKVDREERPDVDSIYMLAIQAMNGIGGWPISIFLTPDGDPFFGGTYFPPHPHHGMPAFKQVLEAVAQAYHDRPSDIVSAAKQIKNVLETSQRFTDNLEPFTIDMLHTAYYKLKDSYDSENGGFGGRPKFPQPMILEFLLRYHDKTANPESLSMVQSTLNHMANGGIYDHLGGGFHRYSTDEYWLVPHFEKMLYDNALLSRVYIHAYQLTKNPSYADIAVDIIDYVLREMTDPQGGFYSSQDADSDGEEGKYFVWAYDEIDSLLTEHDSEVIKQYFGITDTGNFEGVNILNKPCDDSLLAHKIDLSVKELHAVVSRSSKILFQARSQRIRPQTDNKILTSWNSLMIQSMAKVATVLGNKGYLQAAIDSATFILDNMKDGDKLLRTYTNGTAKIHGYLEDYACLANALLTLYESTFDYSWLKTAESLAIDTIRLFWDNENQIFYDTSFDHEQLFMRPRDISDAAMPCGGSMVADMLQRLSIYTGDQTYAQKAVASMRSVKAFIDRAPHGSGHWLAALDFYLSSPTEIAIVGGAKQQNTRTLLETVNLTYIPNKIIAGYDPSKPESFHNIPLLEDKTTIGTKPTAYLCKNYVCQLPVTEPARLADQLRNREP